MIMARGLGMAFDPESEVCLSMVLGETERLLPSGVNPEIWDYLE
jgi:hypothetical protein